MTCGASYAAVPLYRMFCSATSYGGTTQVGHDAEKVEAMETKKDRLLQIKFTADTAAQMQWNFRPQQDSINVYAGETALAFYTVSAIDFRRCIVTKYTRCLTPLRITYANLYLRPKIQLINQLMASAHTMSFRSRLDSTSTKSNAFASKNKD